MTEPSHSEAGEWAMLDDALAPLDALLDGGLLPAGADLAESPARCKAQTLAGGRYRNRPLAGTDYCYVHGRSSLSEAGKGI